MLSGSTKVYGIVGNPVVHSLSPTFQTYFFQQAGIDAVYVPFPVPEGALALAVQGLWVVGVEGVNVTVPYKEQALSHVEPDSDAKTIGAVNTLWRGKQGWRGTNTDWKGLETVIKDRLTTVQGEVALLFGAGGTARAAVHAFFKLGLSKVYICNRSPLRLYDLIRHVRQRYPSMHCEGLPWEQKSVEAACKEACVIVNATSIGLKYGDVFPFTLSGSGFGIDAVYCKEGETPFVKAARKAGLYACDGIPLLLAQGAASFAVWQGYAPPYKEGLNWLLSKIGRNPSGVGLQDRTS